MTSITLFPSEIIEIAQSAPLNEVFRLDRSGKDDLKTIYRNFQIKHPVEGWIPVIMQVFELNTSGSGIPPPSDKEKREYLQMVSISFTDKSRYIRYDGAVEEFGEACLVLQEAQDILLEEARQNETIPKSFFAIAERSRIASPTKDGDGYWINIKFQFHREQGQSVTYDSLPKCEIMDGDKLLDVPVGDKYWEDATIGGTPINCGNIHEFIRAGSIVYAGQFNFSTLYFNKTWIASKGKIDSCVIKPPPLKHATLGDCNKDQMAHLLKKSNVAPEYDGDITVVETTPPTPELSTPDIPDDMDFDV